MFANNPDLPTECINEALEDDHFDLIFHPNADFKVAKKALKRALEDDPDDIMLQIDEGWQSMVENGWRLMASWAMIQPNEKLIDIAEAWRDENY